MRLERALLALAALAAPALLLVPAARGADAPATSAPASPAATDAGAKRHDPDNRTAIAEWMEKCVEGNKRFLAKDLGGALEMYRQAMQLAPKQPIPMYLFAEAQLGSNNFLEAEQALKDAEAASGEKDPVTRGKILFLAADVKERERKWTDAKTAWSVYADFAAKHADAGVAPGSAAARVQAIDDMLKQDKAYEIVRQRIAEGAREGGAAPAAVDAGKGK